MRRHRGQRPDKSLSKRCPETRPADGIARLENRRGGQAELMKARGHQTLPTTRVVFLNRQPTPTQLFRHSIAWEQFRLSTIADRSMFALIRSNNSFVSPWPARWCVHRDVVSVQAQPGRRGHCATISNRKSNDGIDFGNRETDTRTPDSEKRKKDYEATRRARQRKRVTLAAELQKTYEIAHSFTRGLQEVGTGSKSSPSRSQRGRRLANRPDPKELPGPREAVSLLADMARNFATK